MTEARPRSGRRAFTLIELLVVIGIIVLLISILIPVVGKVREKAQVATVQAQINSIDSAVQAYSIAFGGALPGPIPNTLLGPTITTSIAIKGGGTLQNVTGSENLTLGLLGGLYPLNGNPNGGFDIDIVGRGPRGMKLSNPKSNNAFIEGLPLTPPPNPRFPSAVKGEYTDDAGDAVDSVVPEILDRFPESMPILYLRATKGAAGVVTLDGTIPNPSPPPNTLGVQYDLEQILGYTQYVNAASGSIGVGKRIGVKEYTTAPGGSDRPHGLQTVDENASLDKSSGSYKYPFDAFPYFQNRAIPPSAGTEPLNLRSQPHNKDGFILISAGADRVYGTRDDITNFGAIGQ